MFFMSNIIFGHVLVFCLNSIIAFSFKLCLLLRLSTIIYCLVGSDKIFIQIQELTRFSQLTDLKYSTRTKNIRAHKLEI